MKKTLLALACALLTACSIGPNYERPDQALPPAYKSNTAGEGSQSRLGTDWWKLFNDPALNDLEQSAIAQNTDLKAAMARVLEARAAAHVVRSEFFPALTLDPSVTRTRTSSNTLNSIVAGTPEGTTPSTSRTGLLRTIYQVPFDLSYEVDVWGRVRRAYEAANAQAEASVDDYQVVLQTLEADVAQDYFNLRGFDLQDQILDRTVESFREELALTQQQLKAGLVGRTDELQAQAQLDSTMTQAIENKRQRDDEEHALAILLGKTPAEVSVEKKPLDIAAPIIPGGMPADLLKRRPDVAEAEQNLVAASAGIGVAEAAFLPTFELSGSAGYQTFDDTHVLEWANRVWSIGPSASLPIFEGGKNIANYQGAKAKRDEALASYRGAVLIAVRDVEDSLTDLHRRADEAQAQDAAVRASREYLHLSQVEYKQGLLSHLQVIDAERTLLTNEISAAQILNQRLVSTVLLIKALGGGWELPEQQ